MGPADPASAVVRLLVACLLGGVIGWQREAQDRPAGFRTHILVCVGSCLVMLVSLGVSALGAPGARTGDPGRIAAQVVSGIGFLGAGTILRQGNIIRGLTTAASLWIVAGIGLATGVGGGLMLVAAAATLLVLATLTLFGYMEAHIIARRQARELHLAVSRSHVGDVLQLLGDHGVGIASVQTGQPDPAGPVRMHLIVRFPPRMNEGDLTRDLLGTSGVQEVDWEGLPGT